MHKKENHPCIYYLQKLGHNLYCEFLKINIYNQQCSNCESFVTIDELKSIMETVKERH